MPHINKNGTLVANFNDTSEPDYIKHNQCIAYVRVCPKCGTKFLPADTVCSGCGENRPRCSSLAMKGDEYCRHHKSTRPFSLYSKLAGTVSDTVLEELIMSDDHSLSEEFAVARLMLAEAVEKRADIPYKDVMTIIKEFFTIAEKKKKIEEGEVVNITWNDDVVNTMRSRMRMLVTIFADLVKEYVPGKEAQKECLEKLRERTRLNGATSEISHPKDKMLPAPDNIPESERVPLAFNHPAGL